LENIRLDRAQKPDELKIEQNIKLARQSRMLRPRSPAVRPKSRMLPIAPRATVVELQQAKPSREPPVKAKKFDPQTVRAVSLQAAAKVVLPDDESVRNIAVQEKPAEKPVKPENVAWEKTPAASPIALMPPVRTPLLRRTIKVARLELSPLKIAKPDPAAAKLKSLQVLFKPAKKRGRTSAGQTASVAEKRLAARTPSAVPLDPVKTANDDLVLEKSTLPGPSPLQPAVKTVQSFNPRAAAISLLQQSGFETARPDPQGRPVEASPQRFRASGSDALALSDADRKIELKASTSPPSPSSFPTVKTPPLKTDSSNASRLVPLQRKIIRLQPVPNAFAAKKTRSKKRSRNIKPVRVQLASLTRSAARGDRFASVGERIDVRSMLILRSSKIRKKYIEQFGGSQESEKAVNRGLKWLADHQNPDGSWSLHRFQLNCKGKHRMCSGLGKEHSDTAATGLALLPFLAANHTHQKGSYRKTVAAALKWFIDHQKPNGDLLAPGDSQHMYSHGIAAIALCEAFGMTQDPQLKVHARRALDFIIKAQTKSLGGWRYTPGNSSDTSVVGWQVMALKSGEMAGFHVPKKTFDNVRRWLKSVEGNRSGGGTFGYASKGSSPAMTAEGLLCLQFMETPGNDPRLQAGADYLLKYLPSAKSNLTSYYWYYATQVMYHMQGKYWQTWNSRMRQTLVETQIKTGPLAGTWTPRDRWEKRGGRVYSTALRVLILEVYYRHLPIYRNGGQ
ncbi:MAG: hypothetical protein IID45_06860, partial [Planctomycetes bacterium]|nr:hypothetical protein [Planctomycetota bacterium]